MKYFILRLNLFLTLTFSAAADLAQVEAVQARHQAGQTFLTWREVNPPVTNDQISFPKFRQILTKAEKGEQVRYRIYRSLKPIVSVEGLQPVGEAKPLSCWNDHFNGGGDAKETDLVPRYIIEEGQSPLAPGTGLYVRNPKLQQASAPGFRVQAYYAVTYSLAGAENESVSAGNALRAPVEETQGQGLPVLQRIERPKEYNYVKSPTLYYYVRWEAPPNCNVENQPIDYVVGIPPKPLDPAPVTLLLHCWGGTLNSGYGWWFNAEKGSMMIAANQIPYDWWTGYHELYRKGAAGKQAWQAGVVRPYTQTRLVSFLDWAATQWHIDKTRTAVGGISMGGSGSPMFAIRQAERIAWGLGWVGVHLPEKSPTFSNSYAQVYGPKDWNVKFEDGTPVWDFYNDAWYLRQYPEKEIGFISWSNGKNDSAIGWGQAVDFYLAMQETRRPHLFVWGQSGHGQRAMMPGGAAEERNNPLDIRLDQSLPAFTRCSLDGNPGNGSPQDGDAKGMVNGYLLWQTQDIVDEEARWEMTVSLAESAPQETCAVDLTPRRLQKLRHGPGEQFGWVNFSSKENTQVQAGKVVADAHGLITLQAVQVSKGKNRIKISR